MNKTQLNVWKRLRRQNRIESLINKAILAGIVFTATCFGVALCSLAFLFARAMVRLI